MHNLGHSELNLFADYRYAKILIVPIIGINFLRHQYNVFVQLTRCNLEHFFSCGNVRFGHSFQPNYEYLVCSIDKIV